MTIIQKIKNQIPKSIEIINRWADGFFDPRRPKWVLMVIGLLILIKVGSYLNQDDKNNSVESQNQEETSTTDTFIPKGFVLVPVELTNAPGIHSLVGPYTIVDIYKSSEFEESKEKLLAQNLRMIKAPHDDNLFAVLVNENEQSLIEKLHEPIFAVIKNPSLKDSTKIIGPQHVEKRKAKQSRFIFGD